MQGNETSCGHDPAETLRKESGKAEVTTVVGNSTTKGPVSRNEVFVRTLLILATTLLAMSGVAYSDSITANLYTPLAPDGVNPTILDLQSPNPTAPPLTHNSTSTGSFTAITGNGYSITANVASYEGVVVGALPGNDSRSGSAIPVAGVTSGGAAQYLTGNFGSPLTTNNLNAGRYLSTGASFGSTPATITIHFSNPETSLALLWGSIDPQNTLIFMNGNTPVFTVTGKQAEAAANIRKGDGFRGPGGSAYFVIDTTKPFTSVIATSTGAPGHYPSFEFTGIAAAEAPFTTPEPASFWTLTIGFGITVALVVRRRQRDGLRS